MSLLDRIEDCRRWDPARYRPFIIAGRQYGRVDADFAARLAAFPKVFAVTADAVRLQPSDSLSTPEARSAAVREVLLQLREAGAIPIWREEDYPVAPSWGDSPVMVMERGAVPHFGVRAFGVHMNGLVRRPEGLMIWVGHRSLSKPTGPVGKLDHLVAGGQPYGIGIRENLIKECAEEASIPRDLAETAESVGLCSYICERPEGLRDDICFVYDLFLPEDFEPVNTDGEVQGFYLWPIEKVIEILAAGEDFKFNCALGHHRPPGAPRAARPRCAGLRSHRPWLEAAARQASLRSSVVDLKLL